MGHVFIPNPISDVIVERLQTTNEVTLGYGASARTWEDVAGTVEATLVRGDMITAERIRMAPQLKIIARHGVGTNNVDLDAAAAQGVWVTTTPGANAQAVAEHVFALLLSLTRHTARAAQNVRSGAWNRGRTELVGVQLHGKTLLLLGGGGIARLVIPIAKGFGMNVLVHDPYLAADVAEELRVTLIDLEHGLSLADVLSVHVPLTPSTAGLLDARRLGLMKPGSYIINT
ncbi:MAG: NAD(P)-dependent oxidoreductase, partial [Rhodococcus sp. (in: high G+C Gram-positive bacteria)]